MAASVAEAHQTSKLKIMIIGILQLMCTLAIPETEEVEF